MPAGLRLYGPPRSGIFERVYDSERPGPYPENWPTGVPAPGFPGWPHKALLWLAEQVPGNAWIHTPIASRHSWYIALSAELHLQRQIETVREAWRQAGQMSAWLGGMSVQGIRAAAEEEARRLQALHRQVVAVEEALSKESGPGVRRPTP